MFSSMFLVNLLCCITNILGCWQLYESATYCVTTKGERKLISKDVSNVPPITTFLFNGKGIIEFCNGRRILFDWKQGSDNTISVEYSDSIGNKTIYTKVTEDSMILSEMNSKSIINSYLLKQSKMKVEEYEGAGIKISNHEYDSLKKVNPLLDLICFVAEGCEKDNKTLQLGGQEYMEILNGQPNTQYVVFVKSSSYQHNIPCYLVTKIKSQNGIILYANYIRHFTIKEIITQEYSGSKKH